ncbi:hypothetical protein ERHA55_34740 [Erwinia rhapontici]|nr:hypothetical protein ERHA55_34740 [Erwinia rhapontici]
MISIIQWWMDFSSGTSDWCNGFITGRPEKGRPVSLHRAERDIFRDNLTLPVKLRGHLCRQLTVQCGEIAVGTTHNGGLAIIQVFAQADMQRKLAQQTSVILFRQLFGPPVPKIAS